MLSAVRHAAASAHPPAVVIESPNGKPAVATAHHLSPAEARVTKAVAASVALNARLIAEGKKSAQKYPNARPEVLESYLQRDGNTVTGLVIVFTKPLNPTSAQDLSNYLVHCGYTRESNIPVTSSDPLAVSNVAVSSAVYNPTQHSVTLTLTQPFTITPNPVEAWQDDLLNVYSPDAQNTPGFPDRTTITDLSGRHLTNLGLIGDMADFSVWGPSANPWNHFYSQIQGSF